MWLFAVTVFFLPWLGTGRSATVMSEEPTDTSSVDSGQKLVCYYTPTGYFPVTKVPSKACTHLIYAFGSIKTDGSGISEPTAAVQSIWATMNGLRKENPQLKVMLSLQQGFPSVVGSDVKKMQGFANNSLTFLRNYGFDGVDMDWEYPAASQRNDFANFFLIMRAAIDRDSKTRAKPALLLSLALPNNQNVASKSYDLGTIAGAVDFGTAMTYDFHVYNNGDTKTGYNSPLNTPTGEYKYFSASAMAQYYLSQRFPGPKLLLGIPTYGRSWTLASPASHGLHAQAVGKGAPGPYRKLPGIFTYPDACVFIQQGATSVADSQAGAVYLFKDTAWVAYDDVTTVTAKVRWARTNGLGGVGVWAMHLDDIDSVCGSGSLPLIQAMGQTLGLAQTQPRPPHPHPISANAPSTEPQENRDMGTQYQSIQLNQSSSHLSNQNLIQLPDAMGKEEEGSLLVLHSEDAPDLQDSSDHLIQEDLHHGGMLQSQRSSKSGLQRSGSLSGLGLLHPHSHNEAVVQMESVNKQLEN